MRLLVAIIFALFAATPMAAAQSVEGCGDWGSFDWRAHLGIESDALVYHPEFAPEPASEEVLSRLLPPESNPTPGSFSIAVVVVDTSGVAVDIDVACSPSATVATQVASLIQRSEFIPAQNRGQPYQHFLVLPLLSSGQHE